MDKVSKKSLSLWWIIITLFILNYVIDKIELSESFLLDLTWIFNFFSMQILFMLIALIIIILLILPLFYQPKTIKEFIGYFESKVQNKIFICLVIFFALFYLTPQVKYFLNITDITYSYEENGKKYKCSYDIQKQDFINNEDESNSYKCEPDLINGIKYLQKQIKRSDNTNDFLRLVINYKKEDKIKIIQTEKLVNEDDFVWTNNVYTNNASDFERLIIKSLRKQVN